MSISKIWNTSETAKGQPVLSNTFQHGISQKSLKFLFGKYTSETVKGHPIVSDAFHPVWVIEIFFKFFVPVKLPKDTHLRPMHFIRYEWLKKFWFFFYTSETAKGHPIVSDAFHPAWEIEDILIFLY